MANQTKKKVDFSTFIFHFAFIITIFLSLLTGFRITDSISDLHTYQSFSGWLLQGNVLIIHKWAAIALLATLITYVAYLWQSGVHSRTYRLPLKNGTRYVTRNVVVWVGMALVTLNIVTGTLQYAYQMNLNDLHRLVAWLMILYIVFHIISHVYAFGMRNLFSFLRPSKVFSLSGLLFPALLVPVGYSIYAMNEASYITLDVDVAEFAPTIDGDISDWAEQHTHSVMVTVHNGANFHEGATEVQISAVHDNSHIYFLFVWEDASHSSEFIPLKKTEQGWELVNTDYFNANETIYYEDKFAVMFADDDPAAAMNTIHLGDDPLKGKPKPLHGQGYHYAKSGLVDVWHWKSVRTGETMQIIDDNYFAEPGKVNPKKRRYTAGYQKDPSEGGGYKANWKATGEGSLVTPKRLPVSDALIANADNPVPAKYWFTAAESIEYSAEADTLPVGSIIPSIIYDKPFQGDRGDIRGAAVWKNGKWYLEAKRKLDTGSSYDVAMTDDTYLWVSSFDHAQTRHTYHLQPVRLKLEEQHYALNAR